MRIKRTRWRFKCRTALALKPVLRRGMERAPPDPDAMLERP